MWICVPEVRFIRALIDFVDRDGVSNAFQPFHNIYRMLCKRLITFIGCFVSGAYCMEVTGVQWYLSMLKVPRYD